MFEILHNLRNLLIAMMLSLVAFDRLYDFVLSNVLPNPYKPNIRFSNFHLAL